MPYDAAQKRGKKAGDPLASQTARFFGEGWPSLDELRREIAGSQSRVDRLDRDLLDSVIAGIPEFFVATRFSVTTLDAVYARWDEYVAMIGNDEATVGDLFVSCCLATAIRNHIPLQMLLKRLEGNERVQTEFSLAWMRMQARWKLLLDDEPNAAMKLIAFLARNDEPKWKRDMNGWSVTPIWLARQMVSHLPLELGSHVLDPACGRGTFLLAAAEKAGGRKAIGHLYGVDKDKAKAYVTAALISPRDNIVPTIFVGDALSILNSPEHFSMPKFDAVVGNPPYNTSRNADNNQSIDLYPAFIHLAARLAPHASMVTPARWYAKNTQGNRELRDAMIGAYGLRVLRTVNSQNAFGIKIEGGVSFFVLVRGHEGTTDFDGVEIPLRDVVAKYGAVTADADPRMDRALGLIERFGSVTSLFHSQGAFGIKTNYPFMSAPGAGTVPCLFSQQKGGMQHVLRSDLSNAHLLDRWKVVFQAANGAAGPRLKAKDVQKIGPGTAVSESYVFFSFATQAEQEKFFDYITSDNALDLVAKCKTKQHVTREVFRLVPNIRDPKLLEPVSEETAPTVN